MQIVKTKTYIKDLQKKIKNKHKKKEEETIEAIEELIIQSNNMKELMSRVYNIEKKDGNLKEIYTAKINAKIRMHIKPIGEYPYKLEEIIEVELIEIDEKHYGEG